MFGHKSEPCRFYSFGAKAPVEGGGAVEAQMRLAHRYRNALVALEIWRRKRVEGALLGLSPKLAKIESEIAAAEASLNTAREIINKASVAARKKVYPSGSREAAKAALDNLRNLRKERKAARSEVFASDAWQPVQEKINAQANERAKRLYAAVGRMGLGWGTRGHIATTVKKNGAPPRFSRWDGSGHLAVQIQRGMSVAEAFSGEDTRLKIDPLPVDPSLSKAARKRTFVRLRIGSDKDRNPVYAVVPVVLHRPMPEDARIKWVHLIRWRIGTHFEWRVQFVLARAAGWDHADRASDGEVSIDVGWRVTGDDGKTPRPDGSMRVAYWRGSDGAEGELAVPGWWLAQMRKTEDLRSIRDEKLFNPMRDRLAQWVESAKTLPDWLRERTVSLSQWRSSARLAALAVHWRSNRFEGDEQIFAELEAWRKRDKHLYEYEANLRDQLIASRLDLYRNFSAKMRRRYKTCKIEELDLRDFHALPAPENAPVDGALKEHVRDACISSLFGCLKESFGEAHVVKVDPQWTTAKCHICGSVEKWNRKILRHTCSSCGVEWDQDQNAVVNIGG